MTEGSTPRLERLLAALVGKSKYDPSRRPSPQSGASPDFGLPSFTETDHRPEPVELTTVVHVAGHRTIPMPG